MKQPTKADSWPKYLTGSPFVPVWWYEKDEGYIDPGLVLDENGGYRFRGVETRARTLKQLYRVVYRGDEEVESLGYVQELDEKYTHGKC